MSTGNVPSLQSGKRPCSVSGIMRDRILLPEELREEFFEIIKSLLRLKSGKQLAKELSIDYSTFKNYRRGELTIPVHIFEKLSAPLDEAQKQKFLSNAKFLDSNWGAIKGGKRGIAVVRQKYGEEYLQMLRQKGGFANPNRPHPVTSKNIIVPEKINAEIAGLLGVYLGDGTLTEYFMRISGDKRFDHNYFEYLSGVIKRNFGIASVILEVPSTNQLALQIHSKKFVDFFRKNFNLKNGDKIRNQSKIPDFILADGELAKACLRGLMDTDGSFSRRSIYLCMAFTSYSPVLLNQVYELGLKSGYFTYNFKGQVGSNSWPKIKKYFSEVGSSNLRHIIRFEERFKHNKFLYQEETLKYFPEYESVILPHRARVLTAMIQP